MPIHISICVAAVPAEAEAAELQETLRDLLVKYTSLEAASYAAERIVSGVTMDMETFSRERVSEILEDLHGAGLKAAITSEQ